MQEESRATMVELARDDKYTVWRWVIARSLGKTLIPNLLVPFRSFVCNTWQWKVKVKVWIRPR